MPAVPYGWTLDMQVTNTEEVIDQEEPQEHATMAAAQAETQVN